MKYLVPFILLLLNLTTNAQVQPSRNWVDSEIKYTDSKGNSALFTHSFPRGGEIVYKDLKKYGYVVFWTRIVNQSTNAVDLKVKFPDITYFKSPDSYIHIVQPKEKMSIDKVQTFDYGLTDLQSFLNDSSKQLSILEKKINSKEEFIFYTIIFINPELRGPTRAKFELKDQELIYKISMGADTTRVLCGSLVFSNDR